MLFKEVHLKGIQSGNINTAFRRWEKASVKKGSLIKTSVGLIEIVEIETCSENKIDQKDLQNAGFLTKEDLLKSLRNNNGSIFKIKLRYYSEDPRIALREKNVLNADEYAILSNKLSRLDQVSKQGVWTIKILLAIQKNPYTRAIELAGKTGYEKEWLKLNIRKLKNLGLTISHQTGYEISPLGHEYLNLLLKK